MAWLHVTTGDYDVIRLAFPLRDLPVRLLGRVRSDRVFHAAALACAGPGRPGRHGPAMKLDYSTTWPAPARTVTSVHALRPGGAHRVGHHPRSCNAAPAGQLIPARCRSWPAA